MEATRSTVLNAASAGRYTVSVVQGTGDVCAWRHSTANWLLYWGSREGYQLLLGYAYILELCGPRSDPRRNNDRPNCRARLPGS